MVLVETVLFGSGLVLLLFGAEYVVRSAASFAKKLGMSGFIVGLTVVSIGTTLPELAASITASLQQASGFVLGNIVGSCLANIGLILGVSAMLRSIKTKKDIIRREGYFLLFILGLFTFFLMNDYISRLEAGILVFLYVTYVLFLFSLEAKKETKQDFRDFLNYVFHFRYLTTIKSKLVKGKNHKKLSERQKREVKELFTGGLIKDGLIFFLGAFAVAFGAKLLVDSGLFFAELFDVPASIVALTVVAVGTSLPELSVAITAARKNLGSIAIGNVLGANIGNLLLIAGISGLINPLEVLKVSVIYTLPFLLMMTLLFLIFTKTEWRLNRFEGGMLFGTYLVFMSVVLFTI